MKFLICAEDKSRIVIICNDIIDILEERCLGQKNTGMVALRTEISPAAEAIVHISPDNSQDIIPSEAVSRILLEQLALRSHRVSCSVVSEENHIAI